MNIEWLNRAIAGLGSQDTSLTGLDHAIGWLIRCFVEGKFYKLFALLFGMGFAVMLLRAKELGRPFGAWFSRRMLALIAFGLLHMVFLWGGDILHDYGFAGLVLLAWIFLLRKEGFKQYDNPRSFFKLSVIWLSVPVFITIMTGIGFGISQDTQDLTMQWQDQIKVSAHVERLMSEHEARTTEEQQTLTRLKNDEKTLAETLTTVDTIQPQIVESQSVEDKADIQVLSSDELLLQQAENIVAEQLEISTRENEEVAAFTQYSYWQATLFRIDFMAFMLMFTPPFVFMMLLPVFILGYWLISAGVMKNYQEYRSAFNIMAWIGCGLGVGLETAGLLIVQHPVANQIMLLQGVGETLFFVGQYVMAIGYFALIMRLMCSEHWRRRLNHFAPMGRMALTNYIMHSVILTSIFYGYAGGYFGEISRAPQMLIVLAIVIFQLAFSTWWLKYYAFGPLEWLWRCLSYKKMQPMKLSVNT
jgi:uncharacterized membrane protein YeiB